MDSGTIRDDLGSRKYRSSTILYESQHTKLSLANSDSYLRDILGDILGKDEYYPFTRSNQRANENWLRGFTIQVKPSTLAELYIIQGSHWSIPKRKGTRTMKKAHGEKEIFTKMRTKEAQEGHITDCHAGNPCAHQNDPRAKNEDPMIGIHQGCGLRGASKTSSIKEEPCMNK
ncbi:hypothetical protein Tco_0712956 [Tanacetum coccineum]